MLCYVQSRQSCLTLCDPIDGSPLGSTVPGILQARTLEWVAISFSNTLITEEGFLISPAILWNSAFKWVYLSFSPLLLDSLLFTAICKVSSDSHFAFLHFFAPWGWSWSLSPIQCHKPLSIVHQALYKI